LAGKFQAKKSPKNSGEKKPEKFGRKKTPDFSGVQGLGLGYGDFYNL
jgi:hypothetical protein